MNQQSTNISTKDLSYFCDMFNWNLNCYNAFTHFASEITDEDAKNLANQTASMHKEACQYILGILQG